MGRRTFLQGSIGPHSAPPAALLVLVLMLASACGRAPVQTVPVMPDLDVPPAPPRAVEPIDPQAPPPVSLVDAPVRTVERPRAATPPPPRELKPEPKSEPAVEAKPPDEIRPPATLQTAPTEREAEVERRVRTLLQTTTGQLNRIDYRKLNPDVQLQYDTAKRFILQAEEALQARNVVFAATMAEKAATLVGQLPGR